MAEFVGHTGYCNHVLEPTGKCCRTHGLRSGDITCFGSWVSGSRSSLSESGGGGGGEISWCAHGSFKKQREKPPLVWRTRGMQEQQLEAEVNNVQGRKETCILNRRNIVQDTKV